MITAQPQVPVNKERGYTNPLYTLAADHRGSLIPLVSKHKKPTFGEKRTLKNAKMLVYRAFQQAIDQGVPKEEAAILLDEQYASRAIGKAVHQGLTVAVATEKSGQTLFDFEYGDKFAHHIQKYKPTFVKALVRWNPEDPDREKNIEKLKQLSYFCDKEGYKFLIEPLVPATKTQLAQFGGDEKAKKDQYDRTLRPGLTVQMMEQLQDAGIKPDVWKLEGLYRPEEYQAVVDAANRDGYPAGVLVLGRGATTEQVNKWLQTGAEVDGVIGFAIGRTIFEQPIKEYLQVVGRGPEGKSTRSALTQREKVINAMTFNGIRRQQRKTAEQNAVDAISRSYQEFINVYTSARRGSRN